MTEPERQAEQTAPQPPAQPPASPRKPKVWPWVVGGLAAFMVLVTMIDIASPTGTATGAASPSPTPARSHPAFLPTPPPTTPANNYAPPKPGNFKLTVKILRKQCFGSAGCNVTYRIKVAYNGLPLDPTATYEVTYKVKGAEDPIINTFEVTGDSASVEQEEDTQTSRSSDKLTAVVTDVSEM